MTLTSKTPKKNTGTFGIRLKPKERDELERQAGSIPLGTYIKSRLLDSDVTTSKRNRRPVADQKTLAQLLGLIGQSNVADQLASLSTATENGSLIIDDETRDNISAACSEVHAMHQLLLRALGFEVSS